MTAFYESTTKSYENATGKFFCASCRCDKPIAEKRKKGQFRILCVSCLKKANKLNGGKR